MGGMALGILGAGCGGEESGGGGGGGPSCSSPIDAQSQNLRRTLQYVDQTRNEEQKCSNCAQWVADQYGTCGGCNVMTGPVQPNGYCLSWAAAEPPAAEEAPAEPAAEEPAGEAPAAEEAEG